MKKRSGAKRSTLGLIASGAATISIGQKMPGYRLSNSGQALERDSRTISGDARRAYSKPADREYA